MRQGSDGEDREEGVFYCYVCVAGDGIIDSDGSVVGVLYGKGLDAIGKCRRLF